MAMPNHLILVRHGESEGNLIQWATKAKQQIEIPPDFMDRHTCDWRLTSRGIEQAKAAGQWFKKNSLFDFHRYYVSHYLRALETAALLNLPNAKWFKHHYIVERGWGIMDRKLPEERAETFPLDLKSKEINYFYWKPPRGESMLDLCLRVDRLLNTLYRECEEQNIIIVCHGEIMWAFRVVIERITLHDYIALNNSANPFDCIHNCQIIHYSRVDPKTEIQAKYLSWVRSICPWDQNLSTNDWQQIKRPSFSNEQLLKFVKKTARVIDNQ